MESISFCLFVCLLLGVFCVCVLVFVCLCVCVCVCGAGGGVVVSSIG